MRPKCHVRWLRFHFKRMLITGLGQQTLPIRMVMLYFIQSEIANHSYRIGQVDRAYPPFIYIVYTSIHRKQNRQIGLTLLVYLYLYSQKIRQVTKASPPSISLPVFIENKTGKQDLPSLYISTSIHRKQEWQIGIILPLYIYLSLFIENRTGRQGLPSLYTSTSIHRK